MLLHLSRLGEADDDLYDAEALLVFAELVEVLVDFLVNKRLLVLIETAALKDFSDHMRALLVN